MLQIFAGNWMPFPFVHQFFQVNDAKNRRLSMEPAVFVFCIKSCLYSLWDDTQSLIDG